MPKTSIIITMKSCGISKLPFINISYFNKYLPTMCQANALGTDKADNLC